MYVLGTDQRLWREDYGQGQGTFHRNWVDDTVLDYQPYDGTLVYVLGTDRNLWREHGDMTNRTFVDGLVQSFARVSDQFVYVLGTDGNLWLEYPDMYNRVLVDTGVTQLQVVNPPTNPSSIWPVYVMHGDGSLWRDVGTLYSINPMAGSWTGTWVDSTVASFFAMDTRSVYVLGTDGNLWNETDTSSNRFLVDYWVQSFVPLRFPDGTDRILVLGTDGNLWREFGTYVTRDFVDKTVFIDSANPRVPYFAWQHGVSGDPNIFVKGYDAKLWDEGMPVSITPPCVTQGQAAGTGQCCSGLQRNMAGYCMPADPAGCGVTGIGEAPPCCKNSTPCLYNGTCVVDNGVSPPYWYCTKNPTGNPPSPPPTSMQTGGVSCAVQPCLVYCADITDYDCEFGGDFCTDAEAAAAWNLRLGTNKCHACCGLADCQNGSDFVSDLLCGDVLDQISSPP
jgi:hypothetical protein